MIREAVTEDIPEIMALLAHLLVSSGALGKFDEDAVRASVINMLDGEDSVVFRSRRGLISGFTMRAWHSPGWLMAVEMWWWAEDKQWIPLLRAFEQWARERGADEIRISATTGPGDSKIRSIFGRAGFKPSEICYRKEI